MPHFTSPRSGRNLDGMKPILLGMNNPISSDSEHALYPYPPGCTGHRLWEMLRAVRPEVMRWDYLKTFDRRDLVSGKLWTISLARDAVRELVLPPGSVVVVLGEEVRRVLSLERCLIHPRSSPDWPEPGGPVFRQLPHPSGRNPWYRHPTNRLLAGLLLAQLYDEAQS